MSSGRAEELPSGWASATTGKIASLNPRNLDVPPHDDEEVSFVPMAAVEAGTGRLDASHSRVWSDVRSGFTRFQEDDVLFAKITPSMENGKCAIASGLIGRRGAGSTEFHVLRSNGAVLPKLLVQFLLQESVRREARGSMKGVAGQLRVPSGFLENIAFPLPPLPEQHRIVQEIETQLTRLDAAVAALERAQANLKRYRAAVLRAACEGRLVATESELARAAGREYEPADVLLVRILKERRAKRGEPPVPDASALPELPEGWVWATVDQVSLQVQYGTSAKTNEDGEGVPVLRMGNIVDGRLETGELKFLPPEHHEFPDLLLSHGDLLFNRTNSAELVGKSAVYKGQPAPCSFASYLIRVRPAAGFAPDFLAYYLNSSHGRAWIRSVVSQQVGQANVNGSKLRALRIPLPPGAEQRRIVAEMERRLSVIEELETSLDHCVKRADRLRQSILKRAFEGKLVPQDPNDEPASVLLERIRADRAARAQARTSRREGRPSRRRRMPKTAASLSTRRTGVAE